MATKKKRSFWQRRSQEATFCFLRKIHPNPWRCLVNGRKSARCGNGSNDRETIHISKKNQKKEKEDRYVLSPLGCAVGAMLDSGLIEDINDSRIDLFWDSFSKLMEQHGYIKGKKKK